MLTAEDTYMMSLKLCSLMNKTNQTSQEPEIRLAGMSEDSYAVMRARVFTGLIRASGVKNKGSGAGA